MLSNGQVVWDFGGNVWQWVSDNFEDLGSTVITNGYLEYSDTASNFPTSDGAINRLLFAPNANFSSIQNIGKMVAAAENALFRGGHWAQGSGAGLFAAQRGNSQTVSNTVGLRCAYLP